MSTEPFQINPWKAIAQILFLPIMNLIVKSTTFRNDKTRGSRGFRSTNSQGFFSEENRHIESNSIEVEMFASLVHLQPIKGWPPRTTFLSAHPSQVDVRLDTPSGKSTPMVINSGSNITLISSRLIEHLLPPVRMKEGQSIKINQVTRRLTTNQYLPLKVHFSTSEGPIAMDLKAYLVKDMNAPLILVMILDTCLEHKHKVGYLMVTGGDKNLC
jgi:hypothetical protein